MTALKSFINSFKNTCNWFYYLSLKLLVHLKPCKTDKRSHTKHIHADAAYDRFTLNSKNSWMFYSNEDLTGCSVFSQAWIKEGITCSPNKAASNVSVTSKSTLEKYQKEKLIYCTCISFRVTVPSSHIFIHLLISLRTSLKL